MKNNWLYMHTIDGQVAEYIDGKQISFVRHGGRGHGGVRTLAKSLEEIKQERTLTKAWRRKQGFMDFEPERYGYVRIYKYAHL